MPMHPIKRRSRILLLALSLSKLMAAGCPAELKEEMKVEAADTEISSPSADSWQAVADREKGLCHTRNACEMENNVLSAKKSACANSTTDACKKIKDTEPKGCGTLPVYACGMTIEGQYIGVCVNGKCVDP